MDSTAQALPMWETPTTTELEVEQLVSLADLDFAFTPGCASCGSCDEL